LFVERKQKYLDKMNNVVKSLVGEL